MNKQVLLSIVTPAFNRAGLLKRCYESLKRQTDKDFEWIIVDDGSSDNTGEVCEAFVNAGNDFPVTYVWKENGGKHTALNASHSHLCSRFTLILDSDDYLTDDAVEQVRLGWEKYENDIKVGTLIFLRGDSKGNPRAYGEKENTPDDYRSLKRVNVTSSDCCEVFRTYLFKQYPYSEFVGERFLSESELWNNLAEAGYLCVYINNVIYMCEYLEGGLTDSGRRMRIKNPLGGMCTSELIMHKPYAFKTRIKKGLLYICYGYFADLSTKDILLRDKGYLVLKLICLIPGYMMYRVWLRKYTD